MLFFKDIGRIGNGSIDGEILRKGNEIKVRRIRQITLLHESRSQLLYVGLVLGGSNDEKISLKLVHGNDIDFIRRGVRTAHEQYGKIHVEFLAQNLGWFGSQPAHGPSEARIGFLLGNGRDSRGGLWNTKEDSCSSTCSSTSSTGEKPPSAAAAAATA